MTVPAFSRTLRNTSTLKGQVVSPLMDTHTHIPVSCSAKAYTAVRIAFSTETDSLKLEPIKVGRFSGVCNMKNMEVAL